MAVLVNHPRLRLALVAGAAAVLFGVAAWLLPHSPGGIRHAMAGLHWAAPVLFVALWTVLTPALFSGTILAGAAGLLFGAGLGTALGIAGATAGGLVSFAIARRMGSDAFRQLSGPKLKLLEQRAQARPFRAVLLLRIMPGMPATWLNYLVGLTRIRPWPFAAASALGAAPRVFIYAGLGGSLSHASPVITALSISLFVALALLGAGIGWRERRQLRLAASA